MRINHVHMNYKFFKIFIFIFFLFYIGYSDVIRIFVNFVLFLMEITPRNSKSFELLYVILTVLAIIGPTFNCCIVGMITEFHILRCRPVAVKKITFVSCAANVGHPDWTISDGKQG